MWIVIVFGLIFAAAGLFLLWQSVKEHRACRESRNWPCVEGRITESAVQVTRRHHSTSYSPQIAYTYSVLGQAHFSTAVTIGATRTFSSYTKAQAQVAKYPLGQTVSVYYDPQQPAQATLEPGATGGAWATLLMGVITGGMGVMVLILGLVVAGR